jgi:demethylmenaquinone methyltransferase/2-methoxy-6-polyprenyl-1,4-benzoquinol methylase
MKPQPTPSERESATHFGFAEVPFSEKQGLVDDVFHRVAARYDLMNDLMSAGLHRVWKDAMVAALRPPKSRRFDVLDVAGGTGDIALRILDAGGPQTSVTLLDINGDMLRVGQERVNKAGAGHRIRVVQANAESLPFDPAGFDAYTIAFGIRNVPRIEDALAEAYRVLRFGGRLLVLEFAPVDMPLLDRVYDAYSFAVIPRLGGAVTGDPDSYRYLVESIRRFPPPERFAAMIRAAGFGRVSVRRMSGGIVNLHSAWKV